MPPLCLRVGGCVRDRLLGLPPKDIDYLYIDDTCSTLEVAFDSLTRYLAENGYTIFLAHKPTLTVRAKHTATGELADFNLPRKELLYLADSRTPVCQLGTLEDDLLRRDFTVNAMAEDAAGRVIDICCGQEHLRQRMLETPLDPHVSFTEDPLRLLRAFRFMITKGFRPSARVATALRDKSLWRRLSLVSHERILEELKKCFQHDTVATMKTLLEYCDEETLLWIFADKIWLKPTTEKRR